MLVRLLLALALLAALPVGGGASLLAQALETCATGCPDDSDAGKCASDCDDCTCCAHVRTVAVGPVGAGTFGARPGQALMDGPASFPMAAFVDEILHVPRG